MYAFSQVSLYEVLPDFPMFHHLVPQPTPSAAASTDFPVTEAYTVAFVSDEVGPSEPLPCVVSCVAYCWMGFTCT
jgi:hypothetical protein